jgi:hypothetical protein
VLFQYRDLDRAFSQVVGSGEYFITADIARMGKDRTVIVIWHGLTIIEIIELTKSRVNETADRIKVLQGKYSVKTQSIICDDDGIGGGVNDILRCKEFRNGGKANDSDRFPNAKNECYFKLAEYFEQGKIGCAVLEKKEVIMKELDAVRREKPNGDTKLTVISKDKMKVLLGGNSPDYADALMMRMHFETHVARGFYGIA